MTAPADTTLRVALLLADLVDHLDEHGALDVDDPTGVFAELLGDFRAAVAEQRLAEAIDRTLATATPALDRLQVVGPGRLQVVRS